MHLSERRGKPVHHPDEVVPVAAVTVVGAGDAVLGDRVGRVVAGRVHHPAHQVAELRTLSPPFSSGVPFTSVIELSFGGLWLASSALIVTKSLTLT